ncbi:hypothetical protein ACLOJK_029318, partial [Asimina triloba]
VHHFTWAAGATKSGAPPSPQGASMAAQDPMASNHHTPSSSTSRGQQISVTRPLRSACQERQQAKPSNQIQNHGPHPGSRNSEPISSTPRSDGNNKVDWGRSSPTNSKR